MQAPIETERRPWWRGPRVRLSLRVLMILVLVLGGWLGWLVRGARTQREAVAAIQRGGGSVKYDWEWATFRYLPDGRLVQPMPKPGTRPPWPEWLVGRLGPDYFGDIKEVVVGPKDPDLVMARVGDLGRVASLRVALGSPITDDGLEHIRGLTSLESFSIPPRSSDKITGACLESLGGLTGLRRLMFTDGPPLTDAHLAHLRNLSALQELQLPGRGSQVTDEGLANLEGMTDLRYLSLSSQERITSAGLAHFRGMTRLADLWIAGTRIDDLTPIAGATRLTFLQLSSTPITDAGLAPVAGFTALQRLFLVNTPITDAALAHLRGLASLVTLDLFMTRITDVGLAHLAGLRSLQHLTLASTGVSDAGLAHLAGLDSLQNLSLYETKVTDAGMVHLLGLSGLISLNLGKTRVTDAGLALLARLGSLSTLNLAETQVTDVGLKTLAGFKGLKTLVINAKGSRVTDAGLASFQAAHPGVKIARPGTVAPYR